MAQTIFQIVATICCIYTAFRIVSAVYRKLYKNGVTGTAPQGTSVETDDRIKPAGILGRVSLPVIEQLAGNKTTEYLGIAAYRATYLDNYPVANRIQVYMDRDSHTHIKRFLAVVAPDASMSGYVSKIIDEHLKKYGSEMSELYTQCITKPL